MQAKRFSTYFGIYGTGPLFLAIAHFFRDASPEVDLVRGRRGRGGRDVLKETRRFDAAGVRAEHAQVGRPHQEALWHDVHLQGQQQQRDRARQHERHHRHEM